MTDFSDVRALSFDCYGTLIDWETGIESALRPWLARNGGGTVGANELVSVFGSHETIVEGEHPDWLYPEILAETLRRIGGDLGVPVSELEAAAFGRSVGTWPAFADSPAALLALQQRFRLVILSNVDQVSFRQSNDRLGVEFDLIITAQDVGSYKPARENFEALEAGLATIGVEPRQLIHVAESLYHDHLPGKDFGLKTAWIHRRHGKKGFGATVVPERTVTPDFRFTSMEEFAEAATKGMS